MIVTTLVLLIGAFLLGVKFALDLIRGRRRKFHVGSRPKGHPSDTIPAMSRNAPVSRLNLKVSTTHSPRWTEGDHPEGAE
jgi:hypothetical protein